MSLDRDNYYKSLSPTRINSRKAKSLSDNKGLSHKGEFLNRFITTNDKYDDFELTILPYKINLYQGTDFNFEGGKKTIDDYYDYYNKRHKGAYFVSSNKVASIYGINKTASKIIYGLLPDKDRIDKFTKINQYQYAYPLYYIKGNEDGATIRYTLNKNLNL